MGKYKKILVPFDGSVSSRNALRQAIKLSETEKSWIKVLAVVPSYEGDLALVGVSNIREAIEGPTEKLIEEARNIADETGAAIISNIEHGEAYDRIVDVAERENCDLIVMGRRGIHRIQRMLMGSVTSRVIGYTQKDVLVVPRDAEIGWKHVLIATDGSKFSEAATDHALNFARSYGGVVTAVSIVDVTDEFYAQAPRAVEQMVEKSRALLEKVQEKARALQLKAEIAVKEGEAYEKIVELAREKKADIMFLGSHGRTGLKKLLMGSVTEKVIGHTACPVMVVKP